MKRLGKCFTSIMMSVAIFTAATPPASADGSQSASLEKLDQLYEDRDSLQNLINSINTFDIADMYCEAVHPGDKSTDRGAIQHLYDLGAERSKSMSGIRRWLIQMANNNRIVFNALESLIPGGGNAVITGKFFKSDLALQRDLNKAMRAKIAELDSAPTKDCNVQEQEEAFVPVDPLVEIPLTVAYQEAVFIELPDKFCHRDEKNDWYDAIDAQRDKAHSNEIDAAALRDRLRTLKADISDKRQQTWNAADAAAKSGNTRALNNNTAQLKLYDAALKKLDAAIRQATADVSRWRQLYQQLQSQRAAVTAAPITDCVKADITPLDTLTISGYDGLPESIPTVTLEGMEVQDVEFIDVPVKVCSEEMKRSFESKTSVQNSNANQNARLWSDRLETIRIELLRLENAGDASSDLFTKLTRARREARSEHAKWDKIAAITHDIVNKAYAITVEDCSGKGGKMEIGRIDPGFEEISEDIYVPNLLPYDLPAVPDRICSYKELLSLRARAARAREVSAHNRSEWDKRRNALGKLLFNGQEGSAHPITAEYAAHIDATRQSEYWSAQQDVAHKVYWDLMERDSEDCEKADKKVSLNDALQDAIDNRPVINGGQGGGYGGFGRDDIIRNGGCFYPDECKDWMFDRKGAQGGFDGSEAQNALNHTLDGVKTEPKHDKKEQEPHYKQQSPAKHAAEDKTAKTEPVNKPGATAIETMPDVEKTPSVSGPVPVPYPTAAQAADTDKGTGAVKVGKPSGAMPERAIETPPANGKTEVVTSGNTATTITIKAPQVEKPAQPVKQITVQTPETLNRSNITLAPSATQNRGGQTLTIPGQQPTGQMTPVQAPPLVLNETSLQSQNVTGEMLYGAQQQETAEQQNSQGGMVQIAPPPRVYVPHTRESSADQQEQQESQTGQ